MLIIIEVADDAAAAAVKAVIPFSKGPPKLFASQPLPDEIVEEQELEARAHEIAALISPTGNQPMRVQALRVVLMGHDTFMGQGGDSDAALRNGVGALSKALRPISILPSPIDLLCTREKEYFADGPCKGMYRGTRYRPTKLGVRVREILKGKGAL